MDSRPHPRLLEWWRDNPADPDRPLPSHPDVRRLVGEIAPGSRVTDLGGTMSLNARLAPAGLVLRVHQPFVTRQRLLAVQEVRRRLAGQGLVVPVPVSWHSSTVFRCGRRWGELNDYLPHERAAPTADAYRWLFGAMGTLHRALATLDLTVPRPLVATYAPPGSLRRWLPTLANAVQGEPDTEHSLRLVDDLIGRLRRLWVPAARLPRHLIHGDVRLSNVVRTPDHRTAYLDFGFLARRPRIQDLAYAVAFMGLALDGHRTPARFGWQLIPRLLEDYEATARTRLTSPERAALAPYTAAVPLYAAALAGFSQDPAQRLRATLPFLRLSEWLLTHPGEMLG